MVKRIFCLTALLAVLIASGYQSAWAQKRYTQKPVYQTIQQYGISGQIKGSTTKDPTCPSGSGGCLFYGGNFLDNPNFPPYIPNALANEEDLIVDGYWADYPYGAATWVPFTVPNNVTTLTVYALFTNNLSIYGTLDLNGSPAAYYSINAGVAPGNSGWSISSGAIAATSTPTGRTGFEMTEYTIAVNFPAQELPTITLTPGEYWLAVVPICNNESDPNCLDRFFLSDVEFLNNAPSGAKGPAEPIDQSLFDSPFVFGYYFYPAYGPNGACFGYGCDAFSAGVCGIHTP